MPLSTVHVFPADWLHQQLPAIHNGVAGWTDQDLESTHAAANQNDQQRPSVDYGHAGVRPHADGRGAGHGPQVCALTFWVSISLFRVSADWNSARRTFKRLWRRLGMDRGFAR